MFAERSATAATSQDGQSSFLSDLSRGQWLAPGRQFLIA